VFDAHVSRAEVRRISFHGMRHTAATLGLAAGIPTEYVSKWLGHSSVTITQDLYQHVTPSLSEDDAARMTALVLASQRTSGDKRVTKAVKRFEEKTLTTP
jgi:integrase